MTAGGDGGNDRGAVLSLKLLDEGRPASGLHVATQTKGTMSAATPTERMPARRDGQREAAGTAHVDNLINVGAVALVLADRRQQFLDERRLAHLLDLAEAETQALTLITSKHVQHAFLGQQGRVRVTTVHLGDAELQNGLARTAAKNTRFGRLKNALLRVLAQLAVLVGAPDEANRVHLAWARRLALTYRSLVPVARVSPSSDIQRGRTAALTGLISAATDCRRVRKWRRRRLHCLQHLGKLELIVLAGEVRARLGGVKRDGSVRITVASRLLTAHD